MSNITELVSKTHLGPIKIEQLNAGVFRVKANSKMGGIRYSSLKQFGLAIGEYKAITVTELGKKISLASADEKIQLIRQAFLNTPPFKNTFETYQGSTVNKSKIKSYCVSPLNVHPDLADKFVESLLESAEVAKLCTVNGEEVTFVNAKDVNTNLQKTERSDGDEDADEDLDDTDDTDNDVEDEAEGEDSQSEPKSNGSTKKNRTKRDLSGIGIQIDSHTRHDELEKQLKVLRKYGLI